MADAQSDHLKVRCACGTTLKLPASAAGKKAKCPKCEKVFRVPTPAARDPQSSPHDTSAARADMGDGGFSLEDLADMETNAASVSTPGSRAGSVPCGKCGAPMATAAVVCVSCGFNSSTGRTVKAASAKKAAIAGAARRTAAGLGTFALGCILSGAGALVGAGIWFGVVVITEYEIGYIAVALGAMAGYGMVLGYREQNLRAGVTAAGISIVGILAAKLCFFVFINYDVLAEAKNEITSYKPQKMVKVYRLAAHRVKLVVWKKGLAPSDRNRERIIDKEYEKVAVMSPDELEAAIAELDTWEAGDKWDDPAYVHDFVVYSKVDQVVAERYPRTDSDDTDEQPEPPRREWRRIRQGAISEVDGMSADEQLAAAMAMGREQDRELIKSVLAAHHGDLRAMEMGLSYDDERRAEIATEQLNSYETWSDDALSEADAALDKWNEGGKWEDSDFLRSYLIYGHIDDALGAQEREWDDETEDFVAPPEDEWRTLHTAAVAHVDAIPPADLTERARAREERLERELGEAFEEFSADYAKETAGDALGFFFKNYFDPFDAFFALIAVIAAFRIATGSTDD